MRSRADCDGSSCHRRSGRRDDIINLDPARGTPPLDGWPRWPMPPVGSAAWESQFCANEHALKHLFGAGSSARILQLNGRGTELMRITARAIVAPSERSLVLSNGVFAPRFADGVRTVGAQVEVVDYDPRRPLEPDRVETDARRFRGVRAIFFAALESTFGVVSDTAAIVEAVRFAAPDALIVVDAVPLLGAGTVAFSDSGADAVIGVGHKALAAEEGLGFMAVSERFLVRRRELAVRGHHSEFDAAISANWRGTLETTPSESAWVTTVSALRAAVALGDRLWALHASRARFARERLRDAGFNLATDPAVGAPTVTSVLVPPGSDATLIAQMAWERSRVRTAVGRGPDACRVLRVGHLGWLTRCALEQGIAQLRSASELAGRDP